MGSWRCHGWLAVVDELPNPSASPSLPQQLPSLCCPWCAVSLRCAVALSLLNRSLWLCCGWTVPPRRRGRPPCRGGAPSWAIGSEQRGCRRRRCPRPSSFGRAPLRPPPPRPLPLRPPIRHPMNGKARPPRRRRLWHRRRRLHRQEPAAGRWGVRPARPAAADRRGLSQRRPRPGCHPRRRAGVAGGAAVTVRLWLWTHRRGRLTASPTSLTCWTMGTLGCFLFLARLSRLALFFCRGRWYGAVADIHLDARAVAEGAGLRPCDGAVSLNLFWAACGGVGRGAMGTWAVCV